MLPCFHAATQSLKPSTCFEGRPGQEGEPLAGMSHSPPSYWLTFPSFPFSQCHYIISRIHCKNHPELHSPPGQPKILLFIPGPGRVVLPWATLFFLMNRAFYNKKHASVKLNLEVARLVTTEIHLKTPCLQLAKRGNLPY